MLPLQPVIAALPTLAIATVYCFWQIYEVARKQKERRLRERVTWMLWVMAQEEEVEAMV